LRALHASPRACTAHLAPHVPRATRTCSAHARLQHFRACVAVTPRVSQFASGSAIAAQLLSTGARPLIEGNTWRDEYWGVVPGKGGVNKLGELLMLRRAELADELAAAEAAATAAAPVALEAPATKLEGAQAGEAEAEAAGATRKRGGGGDAGAKDEEEPARKAARVAPEVVDLCD
jgi:hypothetical protein